MTRVFNAAPSVLLHVYVVSEPGKLWCGHGDVADKKVIHGIVSADYSRECNITCGRATPRPSPLLHSWPAALLISGSIGALSQILDARPSQSHGLHLPVRLHLLT